LKSGQVSIFSGFTRSTEYFYCPSSVTFSPDGTYLLVCDSSNHCIRKIDLKSSQVSNFAGIPLRSGSRDGLKEQATFFNLNRLIFSSDGTYSLVSSDVNCCIRKICLTSGHVSTFAGIPNEYESESRDGLKEQALFKHITNLTLTRCGKFVIFFDENNIKYIKIKN
jgi:WD40 repeat protein